MPISGKMSRGMRRMASEPASNAAKTSTSTVTGRRNANETRLIQGSRIFFLGWRFGRRRGQLRVERIINDAAPVQHFEVALTDASNSATDQVEPFGGGLEAGVLHR